MTIHVNQQDAENNLTKLLSKVLEGEEIIISKEIVKIHYGKALKTQDRIESGNVPVFAANGQIGFHDVCCINTPTLIIDRKGSRKTAEKL